MSISSFGKQQLSKRKSSASHGFSSGQFGLKDYKRPSVFERPATAVSAPSPSTYSLNSKWIGKQTLSRTKSAPGYSFSGFTSGDRRAELLAKLALKYPEGPAPGHHGDTSRIRISTERTQPSVEFSSQNNSMRRYKTFILNDNPGPGYYRFDRRFTAQGSRLSESTIGGQKRSNSRYRTAATGSVMAEPTKHKHQRAFTERKCDLERCASNKGLEKVTDVPKEKLKDDIATGSSIGRSHPRSHWPNTPMWTIRGPQLEEAQRVKDLREKLPADHSPSATAYQSRSAFARQPSSTVPNAPMYTFGPGFMPSS